MKMTIHCQRRSSQRGIKHRSIELAMKYGRIFNDKVILDKKECERQIVLFKNVLRDLIQLREKGGITVILDNDNLITTYRCDSYSRMH